MFAVKNSKFPSRSSLLRVSFLELCFRERRRYMCPSLFNELPKKQKVVSLPVIFNCLVFLVVVLFDFFFLKKRLFFFEKNDHSFLRLIGFLRLVFFINKIIICCANKIC